MKLKEFEGKKLLEAVGILTSKGILVTSSDQIPSFQGPKMFKVQTLAGGRGKAGGIKVVNSQAEAKDFAEEFFSRTFLNESIAEILIEEKLDIAQEFYLGIMFDTCKKCPVLIFSLEGGVDIEELRKRKPEKIHLLDINYLHGLSKSLLEHFFRRILSLDTESTPRLNKDTTTLILDLIDVSLKLYHCFQQFDCRMIEVNPLIRTTEQKLIAADAVAVLDDDADFRREIKFSERTDIRKATAREIAARQIDKDDYRGVAGKTFLDLDGDIAILTSGGGASMTLMDSLINLGGKPANFTEYSGDPPTEKVEKLTRIVLDKKNISGMLIGGVIANFTNIAATLQGVLNVLKERKPDFPIVIRRAGPHDEEAKEMINQAKDEGFDIHYFDEKMPLTRAAEIVVELSEKYKLGKAQEAV